MTPPVFAHGHLRLYLLSLLAESDHPMHGYELIQALGDRFGGTYVPSAGTIYPRLAKLEDEGMVTKVADGRKTVYEITDAGRAELAARESELVSGYCELEFCGLVTVTATTLDQLERSCAEWEQVAAHAGLELRRLNGQHDVAFACTLPVGIGPSRRSVE